MMLGAHGALYLALLLLAAPGTLAKADAPEAAPPQVDFDYLTLTRTWPPSLCAMDPCSQPTYNLFTIHGLWPSNKDGNHPADCKGAPAFKRELLPYDMRARMSCEWRNFKTGDLPQFWGYEWGKHGTCAAPLFNNSVPDYFGAALALHEQYDINEAMVRSGFNPLAATQATAAQMVGLLKEQWNVTTAVTCTNGNIYEVKTCFNLKLKPINCPDKTSCPKTAQDLPFGGPVPQACTSYFDNVPAASNVAARSPPSPPPPPPPPPPSGSRAAPAPGAAAALAVAAAVAFMLLGV